MKPALWWIMLLAFAWANSRRLVAEGKQGWISVLTGRLIHR